MPLDLPQQVRKQAKKFEKEACKAIEASCHSDAGALYTKSDDEIELRDGHLHHYYTAKDEDGDEYEVCSVRYKIVVSLVPVAVEVFGND